MTNRLRKNASLARHRALILGASVSLALSANRLRAQPAVAPVVGTPTAGADVPVPMEFPADGVELKTLTDIVTKRLHIPILYDDTILNKRVIIRVPVNVPESSLLGVLQSALRMKQLALVDADQPGWKQIVPVTNLALVGKPVGEGAKVEPATPVTQIFALKHADPTRLVEAVRPFLSTPGGNATAVAGQKAIIVSDYPSAMTRVTDIVKMLDTEGAPVDVQFVPLQQAEASTVAPIVTALLSTKESYQTGAAPAGAGNPGVLLQPDDRMNQIVVIAPPDRMKEVLSLIGGLDKAVDSQTKVYHLKTIAPDRVDKLVKNLLGGAAKRTYRSTIDPESQSLVVSASPDVHARVEALVKDLDNAAPEAQSPIRFYKLKNTKAADVLATISGLYGSSEGTGEPAFEGGEPKSPRGTGMTTGARSAATGNMNLPPDTSAAARTATAGVSGANTGLSTPRALTSLERPSGDTSSLPGAAAASRYGANTSRAVSGDLYGDNASGAGAVHAPNAVVTADANTNSIIVIAAPAVQQTYAELIKRLDERRPQVQVEVTIVTIDTTDGWQFGVDIGKLGGFAGSKLLSFSSFGISKVDPATGKLTPLASPGGTLALLSPGIADVVLNALANNSRARLVSAPQLLVNDNGKGKLQSVQQEPFAEILDTASTQSRTGLGGQAEAGTTVTIEPHISQDDYLQLAYSVELSSFTGTGSNGLPPPSQKNTIDSTVTIPDGYTIVVGGLAVHNIRETIDSLPFIRDIPLVNLLFSNRTNTKHDTTLFVFIKPVILRDDKFDDLKYLSDGRKREAGLPGTYPVSEPIPIR